MAATTHRTVALLAIHPCYAKAILAGTKRVEFRKTLFKREISHVVIYCTSPIMRVIGVFEVNRVRHANPSALWKQYQAVGGIERHAFAQYYGKSKLGVAVEVGRVWALSNPLELRDLALNLTPPQGYRYLDSSCLLRLLQTEKTA